MSAVVIHNYGNSLETIISYIAQTSSDGSAKILDKDIIHHDELPTIKTAVGKGDKVIGGYLYNTILLLAPDANTYAKITSAHDKLWIHPDHFALFLSKEGDAYPTKENLAIFAREYQVGLIYIVRNGSAVLLDPISGQIVGKKVMGGLPASSGSSMPSFSLSAWTTRSSINSIATGFAPAARDLNTAFMASSTEGKIPM